MKKPFCWRSLFSLLVLLLGTAATKNLRAQGGVDLYGPNARAGTIGTGMGGFHGSGFGGGFYQPDFGPSMPGYQMPREALPSMPAFNGNLMSPVTPFAPMSKIPMKGASNLGLYEKPEFGPRPQFNWTPAIEQPNMAPHYSAGFSGSMIGGMPNEATPDFSAFHEQRVERPPLPRPTPGYSQPQQEQAPHPYAHLPRANPMHPAAIDPRWWPANLPHPSAAAINSDAPIGARPWPTN